MLKHIIFSLFFSSALLFAQSGSIHGNLIRIPFDASQINPADTMGNWVNGIDSVQHYYSYYTGVVHTSQNTYFEKYTIYDGIYFLMTNLDLEDFNNSTSDSYGGWLGYYDIPEPYILYKTVSQKVENGIWLMNGVYNMAFISDDDEITLFEDGESFQYISAKIDDKYLTAFRIYNGEPAYDFYLLNLSNSPDFDTTNAQKVYFDAPLAPYKMFSLGNSLYLAGVDSLPYGGHSICLFKFVDNTFNFLKRFFYAEEEEWYYREGELYLYDYPNLKKYDYNPSDTSFTNSRVIVPGGGQIMSRDFSYTVRASGDSLLVYNNNSEQLINTIDISSLNTPQNVFIDSPYVYIHQTTFTTDVKDETQKPVAYNLQVYPNPFNPATNVFYTIPQRGLIEIKLFDVLGREVKEIFKGESEAGNHTLQIDGSDLSSGVYFVRFVSNNYVTTKKVLLLK